jgi:rare lipoprotein A
MLVVCLGLLSGGFVYCLFLFLFLARGWPRCSATPFYKLTMLHQCCNPSSVAPIGIYTRGLLTCSILVVGLFAACAPASGAVATSAVSAQTLDVSEGRASWYGPGFDGRRTANGEIYDSSQLTAAHKTLPFGTFVRVTNPSSGASVVVRINDRGPFKPGRVIDVSRAAAEQIGMIRAGTMVVRLELVSEQVQSQAVAAGNVILAADAGLTGYNVISSEYRVGQLLLLSSPAHPQTIIVRVASNNMPVSSGVQMFAANDLFAKLGDRITVTVGN